MRGRNLLQSNKNSYYNLLASVWHVGNIYISSILKCFSLGETNGKVSKKEWAAPNCHSAKHGIGSCRKKIHK